MTHVRGAIHIAAPVETVFDVVADPTNEPSYNPALVRSVKVTPGPVREGSRFRADAWSAGREVPMTIELVEFEWPHRLGVLTSVDGMVIDGTLEFAPCATGTVMTWDWDVHALGRTRGPGPVSGLFGRRRERRVWEGLKWHLERQAVSPARE